MHVVDLRYRYPNTHHTEDREEHMLSIMDVANFLTTYSYNLPDEEKLYPISNLRLQKLLYYIQGASYMRRGEPLFSEDFYAWRYGPVNKETYDAFKGYGYSEILPYNNIKLDIENTEINDETFKTLLQQRPSTEDTPLGLRDQTLVKDVYHKTIEFSNFELVQKTHEEAPWKDAYNWLAGSKITQDSMKQWFLERKNQKKELFD